MYLSSKDLLDSAISRRTFIQRMTAAGVSLVGAQAMAQSLAGSGDAAHSLEPTRILTDLTGGELMAEFLIDWNIPYVFGLAGSEEIGFLDALVDRTAINYATCIHEQVAMAMADGYSRSTGDTSIVCLHSIAGAAYALGQLVSTYRDRIPVVVTAGRQATGYRGQDGFLEDANLKDMPKGYAQWTWDVMSAETIPEVLRRAFLLAEAPPGGPTFVTFSKDLWEASVARAEIIPRSRSRVSYDVRPPESHVSKVADLLTDAQLPVLFVGNEAIRYDVSEEVAGIADVLGALVMTASKIPVVFPNTHPNFAGQFLDDTDVVKDVDVFWSIGAHMFKRGAKPQVPYLNSSTRIMHTGLNDGEVARNYPVDTAAIADIKTTTAAVLDELTRRNLKTSAIQARRRWIHEYRTRRLKQIDDFEKLHWDDAPISLPRLFRELDRQMESDAYVVSEVVTSDDHIRRYVTFDHKAAPDKRRRNFDTTGGILGWGCAAALGVKIGNPEKEVWCLTGDGAFNFGSQALWSATRYEVPVGFIVFNNGEYQANRRNSWLYQGRMAETGKFLGVNLGHPDINYVSMAHAYGIEGERIEGPAGLAAAIGRCKRAMADGRPYLVDVIIERRFDGKDSDWYDFFSVARNIPRQT
ncbi:MAG: thiamine pyrophosphate-binding protein [Proteobacteria bacterium]|nr:thiamine pyrophosphate-binding protein [Pseudomonadota bacterium]